MYRTYVGWRAVRVARHYSTRTRLKSQDRLTRILEYIFGMRAETEKTFPWLISPKGAHLRVDIYFSKLKLAVEYHGKQHAEFPNAFHKTAEEFRYAAMCDIWKIKQLKAHGVTVIEFSYRDKLTLSSVIRKLRQCGVICAAGG